MSRVENVELETDKRRIHEASLRGTARVGGRLEGGGVGAEDVAEDKVGVGRVGAEQAVRLEVLDRAVWTVCVCVCVCV